MSGNSSATGGFLKQQNVSLTDDATTDLVQEAIVGILGFDPTLIRPRWQPNPPRAPERDINWAALGITLRSPFDFPSIKHINGGPDILTRWSTVTVLVSFYGPDCQGNAESLRDGLYIGQNLEQLNTDQIKLLDAGEIAAMPEVVNNQWYNRADLPIRFSVSVSREYNVLDLVASQGTITTQNGVAASWDLEPPP